MSAPSASAVLPPGCAPAALKALTLAQMGRKEAQEVAGSRSGMRSAGPGSVGQGWEEGAWGRGALRLWLRPH